ncbi:MAG: copper resistance protein CopC [Micromonosporaceae bacterium]
MGGEAGHGLVIARARAAALRVGPLRAVLLGEGLRRRLLTPRVGLPRAGLAVVAGALAALCWAAPAVAHAALLGSSPANGAVVEDAPSVVTLRFSEPVEPVPGQVRILAPDGGRADNGEPRASGGEVRITMRDGAPKGTYLVTFRVVSADGHPVTGGFTFSVGEPSKSPPPAPATEEQDPLVAWLLPALRYLGYAGLVLLAGAVGALGYAWPPRLSRRRPARLAWLGAAAVAGSALGEMWLQAPYLLGTGLTGVGTGDLLDVLDSQYGYAHLARLGCLALAVPLLRRVGAGPLVRGQPAAPTGRPGPTQRPGPGTAALWRFGPLVLGVCLLTSWPLSGHPASAPLPWLAVALDTAHLAAVSIWLGGLLVLAVCLLPAEREAVATLLPAWSRWAFGAVAVLVVSGVSQAALEVAEFAELVNTRYGLLLLIKAGILVALLILGGFAQRLVRRQQRERLRRVIAVELVFAAVVLAVTSVLVQTTPARTEASVRDTAAPAESFRTTLQSPLYQLHVAVEPTTVGNNSVDLHATTAQGGTLSVEEWRMTVALPERDIAPIDVPLLELTDDHAVGEITLPAAGRWEFRFTLRTSEIDQATVRVTVTVR